jgi:hypothetical protein
MTRAQELRAQSAAEQRRAEALRSAGGPWKLDAAHDRVADDRTEVEPPTAPTAAQLACAHTQWTRGEGSYDYVAGHDRTRCDGCGLQLLERHMSGYDDVPNVTVVWDRAWYADVYLASLHAAAS